MPRCNAALQRGVTARPPRARPAHAGRGPSMPGARQRPEEMHAHPLSCRPRLGSAGRARVSCRLPRELAWRREDHGSAYVGPATRDPHHRLTWRRTTGPDDRPGCQPRPVSATTIRPSVPPSLRPSAGSRGGDGLASCYVVGATRYGPASRRPKGEWGPNSGTRFVPLGHPRSYHHPRTSTGSMRGHPRAVMRRYSAPGPTRGRGDSPPGVMPHYSARADPDAGRFRTVPSPTATATPPPGVMPYYSTAGPRRRRGDSPPGVMPHYSTPGRPAAGGTPRRV